MAHDPGTFCWTDLAAPDVEAAERFYGDLFGWTGESAGGNTEETRDYRFFLLDGKRVCGYGTPGAGEPPSWRPYVAVQSADDAAARVSDNGGQLLLEPMDVLEEGRVAVFTDPTGAVCCVWQPRAHEGAQLIREPNTLGWVELATRDVEGAKAFYTAVFGWDVDGAPGEYAIWRQGDGDVGGLTDMEQHPPEVPPHWLVNFGVEDVDAHAARVGDLGGAVRVPPTTVPTRDRELRFAVLADPNGAVFGIFAV